MAETLATNRAMTEAEAFFAASKFLAFEAKLLDERRFDEWYELLDDDIVYEVPIRLAKIKFSDETQAGGHFIFDTKRRLKVRIDRLNCGECWSETPPSRTVRVVGSVLTGWTDRPDVIEVESALLLYRQRSNDADGDLIPVRRTDELRIGDAGVKLLKRRALLSDISLRTPNLGVFV
ncbi:MAG TPA: aromatic-ring-hydroxylating dioxygenase subunit beta [Sphingomicrobium sp.]|nr:aromatic-ring-hydroxylating dioxygenase subunit beta [Sphingomicrobium sp.]